MELIHGLISLATFLCVQLTLTVWFCSNQLKGQLMACSLRACQRARARARGTVHCRGGPNVAITFGPGDRSQSNYVRWTVWGTVESVTGPDMQ